MRRPQPPSEATLQRLGSGLLGYVLLTSAAISAGLARDEIVLRGVMCGASHPPHCGWCYGAVGFALAGITAWAVALRAGPAPALLPPAPTLTGQFRGLDPAQGGRSAIP